MQTSSTPRLHVDYDVGDDVGIVIYVDGRERTRGKVRVYSCEATEDENGVVKETPTVVPSSS
jgi:hypothetical protein